MAQPGRRDCLEKSSNLGVTEIPPLECARQSLSRLRRQLPLHKGAGAWVLAWGHSSIVEQRPAPFQCGLWPPSIPRFLQKLFQLPLHTLEGVIDAFDMPAQVIGDFLIAFAVQIGIEHILLQRA